MRAYCRNVSVLLTPSYEGNDSDFKECPKRQNKPQNAQAYTRGESVLFNLLNES